MPLSLDTSSETSNIKLNNMSEGCCGGKRRGFGIYTDEYYINKLRAGLRSDAIQRVVSQCGSDGVLVLEELNAMNRASNKTIANNHELRAEIYELKSEINRLNEIVRLVSESNNMEDVNTALNFPYKSKYTPIQE
jgi:hypothetical protein